VGAEDAAVAAVGRPVAAVVGTKSQTDKTTTTTTTIAARTITTTRLPTAAGANRREEEVAVTIDELP
jgi:hypothetical protein